MTKWNHKDMFTNLLLNDIATLKFDDEEDKQ